MTKVVVKPLLESYRKISKKYRPVHPPIFQDCGPDGPSESDIALARELFLLLDDESRDWYQAAATFRSLPEPPRGRKRRGLPWACRNFDVKKSKMLTEMNDKTIDGKTEVTNG